MTKIDVDRPPRIQPELPIHSFEIPAPPEKQQEGNSRLIQVMLPLLTIIGYVLVSILGSSGRNPLLLIPMAISVVASSLLSYYLYKKEQRRRAETERAYRERLTEMNKEMHAYHDIQRRFYRYNYPGVDEGVEIALAAAAESIAEPKPTLRTSARLWERRTGDQDFGAIRIGIGTIPSSVVYKLNNADNFADPQMREAIKLDADSRFVTEAPLIIQMYQGVAATEEEPEDSAKVILQQHIPRSHAIGVAGESSLLRRFTHAILMHYVTFHAPIDAQLYILAAGRKEWPWADTLPHSRSDEQNRRCCFIDMIVNHDSEEGELKQYLESIRKMLAQRKMRLQDRDNTGNANANLPMLLMVVDLLDLPPASPLAMIEAESAISILLEEGHLLGAAVIFLVPSRGKVPSGCQAVIEIERIAIASSKPNHAAGQNAAGDQEAVIFRYAEEGVNSFRYLGAADCGSIKAMDELARLLERLNIRQSTGTHLPSTVPLLYMMNLADTAQLKERSLAEWQRSLDPRHANWLKVKIGKMMGNTSRTLVFSSKGDGVHGMVAGSTGSGKSELLVSLIIGLAIAYDPRVLNFVLVDFKGGGAFEAFRKLPHCVDIITNLAGDGVTRMFTAITAELQHRQRLIADHKTIVQYRLARKAGDSDAPLPFLFIIIDEYAEMIAARDEFKAQLDSITRLGRSLGVSLILAAQRPTGVTDQMRANIKFRICLRVEGNEASREMLRRSDAAFLPPNLPGRGYLQVGNEEVELLQFAYTGDEYADLSAAKSVIWPQRSHIQDQIPQPLYKEIIDILAGVAEDLHIERQLAPWPDVLPAQIGLTQPLIAPGGAAVTHTRYMAKNKDSSGLDAIAMGQPWVDSLSLNPALARWLAGENGWVTALDWKTHAMRPVVGLVDDPYNAAHHPLVIDLQLGHVVLFGGAAWGKTTLIQSLVLSLAASHGPGAFHCYLLDLGGGNLESLEGLPHCGGVIVPEKESYEERVAQLMRQLTEMVRRRKDALGNSGLTTIYEYNAAYPGRAYPAVLVAIDHFIEFIETFGNAGDNPTSILDEFINLARQAKTYAIHFVITINRVADLSSQLYSVFTERLVLKLSDATEYRLVLGNSVEEVANIPGRGYLKHKSQPLGFQIGRAFQPAGLSVPAAPAALDQADPLVQMASETEASEKDALKGLIARMNEDSEKLTDAIKPEIVSALGKDERLEALLARQHGIPLDETFYDQLKKATKKGWKNSRTMPGWLKVSIGKTAGDRERTLTLSSDDEGVHGMIAGATGSGKSELLMAIILDMALRYPPDVLNFVLIDYKGGSSFQPFRHLPHTVDIATNLNKSAVHRMFTAVRAEMDRRQKLIADSKTSNIVEYRRSGHALPYLMIIIDEFAEMIGTSREFRDELESITRIGRSIGVHLILAAQRPTGVTDQMRANIKFKICLRVEGADSSREILHRADAAFLPSIPGRGYLQVGNNPLELIQAPYTGSTIPPCLHPETGQPFKIFELIVHLARQLQEGAPAQQSPWPQALGPGATVALNHPFEERYLHEDAKALLQLGRSGMSLELNRFAGDWAAGRGSWPGIDWGAYAMRAVLGVIDHPAAAAQLPLEVNFRRGHAVLFGGPGWGKTTALCSLVLSLCVTHAPRELHVHVIGGRNLSVLDGLPHVGTLIITDDDGYEERVQQLFRELTHIIDQRKQALGSNDFYSYNARTAAGEPALPAVLVAIDTIAEFIETFGNPSIAAVNAQDAKSNVFETFVTLARQGKSYGIHFFITAPRLNVLSSKVYGLFNERLTLRLADSSDYPAIVGQQIGEIDAIPGRGAINIGRQALLFQISRSTLRQRASEPDQPDIEVDCIGAVKAAMNGQTLDKPGLPFTITALASPLNYRDILHLPKDRPAWGALKEKMAERWQATSAAPADWLRVLIGYTSGNKARELTLMASQDGAHGMIAGSTGSGKSELLMTLIVGLASAYPPESITFVLVDYKGGGAFEAFRTLPHTVDFVTNLNKSAVHRMFTAITAEIERRQRLNAETKTKTIVEYRQLAIQPEPYPHLFILIDEYVQMFEDHAEFLPVFEQIARVGRAQGVHLILAAQQPKNVTDQMRANIKLRICLRVEDADTSRELLRRPDAAYLSSIPGRGYIQAGKGMIELIQVAYVGEDLPDDRPDDQRVSFPDDTANPSPVAPKLFDAVVRLARELRPEPTRKPWPSALPAKIGLRDSLLNGAGQQAAESDAAAAISRWLSDQPAAWTPLDWRTQAMRPTALIVDDPTGAKQYPYQFDLRSKHVAVFGDSGMGKTTLLRTLVISLAATHAPEDLHLYILDLGGRSFDDLKGIPHIGAILRPDENDFEERLQRLITKLNHLVDRRQQQFSEVNVETLYAYNERNPEGRAPAIVVLIDQFAVLQEGYTDLVETTLMPLIRRCISAGIAFVVTANVPNAIPYKLLASFVERLTFRQSDQERYADIVGRISVGIDEIPGRGYLRSGTRPLLFHAAQPVGPFLTATPLDQKAPLGQLVEALGKAVAGAGQENLPDRIPSLTRHVALRTLLEQTPTVPGQILAPIGIDTTLKPHMIDLKRRGPHFAIVGAPLSGKTATLHTWVLALAERHPPSHLQFLLIDPHDTLAAYGGEGTLANLPHVAASFAESGQVRQIIERLELECQELQQAGAARALFVMIDNFEDFNTEVDRATMDDRARLISLIRRHRRTGLHFVIALGAEIGSSGDLRRTLLEPRYGLVLGTADGFNILRPNRMPPMRAMPGGRGYLVKSGQTTLIQVADPYADVVQGRVNPVDQAELQQAALDSWVKRLVAKYPAARRLPPLAAPRTQPGNGNAQAVAETQKLMYRAIQHQLLVEQQPGDAHHSLIKGYFQLREEERHSLPDLHRLLGAYLTKIDPLEFDYTTADLKTVIYRLNALLPAANHEEPAP
jgi:S-DNA-T family DNA segregation ATPase FtsK/SpoIIIE